jgi:hypothetical protein
MDKGVGTKRLSKDADNDFVITIPSGILNRQRFNNWPMRCGRIEIALYIKTYDELARVGDCPVKQWVSGHAAR